MNSLIFSVTSQRHRVEKCQHWPGNRDLVLTPARWLGHSYSQVTLGKAPKPSDRGCSLCRLGRLLK